MQLKVDEHKKLLSQYESKSYLYGRQAEDFKAHCQRLINVYEKAAEENLEHGKNASPDVTRKSEIDHKRSLDRAN